MRIIPSFLLTALGWVYLPSVDSCGFTTHQVISHRAFNYYYIGSDPRYPSFAELLDNQIPSFEAGSPYPDYLYECGSNHSNGEYSHWAPFQSNLVTYIRQMYGIPTVIMPTTAISVTEEEEERNQRIQRIVTPWNISGQKLVAFGFGIVSHYIADISWHGLAETPNFYGLIETIGGLDFNDTGPGPQTNAHTQADTGGEFSAAYTTMLNFLHPEEWYIPVQDLLNTYALVGINDVKPGDIEECAAIFFAGSEAIKAVAALAEPLENAPSPVLEESYIDMPLGGLDDMAVWTSRMWQRFASWLVNGIPDPVPGINSYSSTYSHQSLSTNNDNNWKKKEEEAVKKKVHRIQAQTDLRRLYRIFGSAMLHHNLTTVIRNTAEGSVSITKSTEYTVTQRSEFIESLVLSTLQMILNGTYPTNDGTRYQTKATEGWTVLRSDDYDPIQVAQSLGNVLHSAGVGYIVDAVHQQLSSTRAATKGINKYAPEVLLEVLDRLVAVQQSMRSSSASSLSTTADTSSSPTVIGAPSLILASSTPLEYVGKGLTHGDYDHDGLVDIIFTAYGHSGVGTLSSTSTPASYSVRQRDNYTNSNGNTLLPQSGGFYTRYGNFSGEQSYGLSSSSSVSIDPVPVPTAYATFGTDVFTRLGWDICTLDINADGIDDIAVSAPTAGWSWGSAPSAPLFFYPGKVYVYMGANNSGIAADQPDLIFYSSVNDTHLGMKLVCQDVSGDNVKDLIIGSPFAIDGTNVPGNQNNDPYTATQAGRVDIVLSSSSFGPPRAGTLGPIAYDITLTANYTIGGSGPYEWLGYSIAVLESGASSTTSLGAHLHLSNEDILSMHGITMEDIRTLFTSSSSSSSSSSVCSNVYHEVLRTAGNDLSTFLYQEAPVSAVIAIGSPGYRAPFDGIPSGRVATFALPLPSSSIYRLITCIKRSRSPVAAVPLPFPSPLFTVTADPSIRKGTTITTKLGADISIGYPFSNTQAPYMAIGIPNVDFCNSSALLPSNATSGGIFNTSAGAVFVFNLDSSLRGDYSYSTLVNSNLTRTLLAASWPDARFGWKLRFDDINNDSNDDLFIAAPMYTPFFIGQTRVGATDSGHEAGSLLLYLGGTNTFPQGYICDAQNNAVWRADGDVEFGRFGSEWIYSDYNGDGLKELIVSAPRAYEAITQGTISSSSRSLQDTTFIEMPGAIYIYSVNITNGY